MEMQFYVVRLPGDHPTAPGRYEVDVQGSLSFEQGGRHVAGPLGGLEEANVSARVGLASEVSGSDSSQGFEYVCSECGGAKYGRVVAPEAADPAWA